MPCSSEGIRVLRAAKRLLSARRCATRVKVSSLMIAGTGISVHSSTGPVDGLGGAWGGAALQAGDPVQGRGFVHDHRLAEHRASGALPTRFIRSVVTDDQGRYLVPDLPKADYDVWVRGYGLVDSAKGQGDTRSDRQSQGARSAGQEGSRVVLPGAVLVRADADAAEERLPGHR